MGLFVHDDPDYNEAYRMTGFNRYKQLLSFHAGNWLKVNLITTAGILPFAALCTYAILSSSSLVMLLGGLIGGAIFGPFWAGLHSVLIKGMMDAPGRFWENYRKSWKLNLKSSLLPGAIMGLFAGMFLFMAYMMYTAVISPSLGTLALYFFGLLLYIFINTLLWPQLVLFDQTLVARIRNIILFGSKYLWKVLRVSALPLAWLIILFLFAPFTLLVIPCLGFWYVLFLSELILYEDLNRELHLEELYGVER